MRTGRTRPILIRKDTNMIDRKLSPQDRYNKEKTTTMNIRFMKNTEQDLIDHLNAQPNKAGYIKSLIRADMAKK